MKQNDRYIIGKIENEIGTKRYIRYRTVHGDKARWVEDEWIIRRHQLPEFDKTLFCIEGGRTLFANYHDPLANEPAIIELINKLENHENAESDEIPNFDHVEGAPAVELIQGGEDERMLLCGASVSPLLSPLFVWGEPAREDLCLKRIVNWTFTPDYRPAFALLNTKEMSALKQLTSAPVNDKKGKPCAWMVFNSDLASEKRPLGAHLDTSGAQLHPLPHYVVFDPFIQRAEVEGWSWSAIAYEEGKKARCDIRIDDLSTYLVDGELTTSLSSSIDGADRDLTMQQIVKSHVFGFTVFHGFDGGSTVDVQVTAQCKQSKMLMALDCPSVSVKISHKHDLAELTSNHFESRIKVAIRDAIEQMVIEATGVQSNE